MTHIALIFKKLLIQHLQIDSSTHQHRHTSHYKNDYHFPSTAMDGGSVAIGRKPMRPT